ncbi:ATP-grasp domain-containing protein [Streptomyces durbertensis]|uniref:ATP-grasp domain-containing protein n=1 Tax=Streptomyces durbertensis TaxID=2448886 RepID=A0ABR6EKN6_9ACTN|nr:ATP-grasp domain-containing protein [Streptomyces durbertensis]MBB1245672.1 ATP-grasp domain-containing protein [Streptomyces durbertensis]
MSRCHDGAPETVTHVMAGFGAALLPDLDRCLPPRSLLVVEEPDVVAARDLGRRATAHPCVAGVLTAPIHEEDDLSAVLAAVPRPRNVRAVLPGVEYGVSAAAALADHWGLPGAGVTAARVLRDKALLREAGERAGVPQPRWRRATCAADVRSFRDQEGHGCVLKPANRQGSLGVQLLDATDDLDEAWRHTVEADEPRLRARRPLPASFLVEERVDGPEISVECVVFEGQVLFRNVTAKNVRPGRHPVEMGHHVPAILPPGVSERVTSAMERLVAATGFRTGFLHAEWILRGSGRQPVLVECAGRVPGDCIHELIDLAHGGSLLADLLTVLSGSANVPHREPHRHAAIRFLNCPPGKVLSVRGTQEAEEPADVVKVHIATAPGKETGIVSNSHERAGYVVVTGRDRADTTALLDAVSARIRFDVRPRQDAPKDGWCEAGRAT